LPDPEPGDRVITVSNIEELTNALSQAEDTTTIYLESGTYPVNPSSFVVIETPGITIRSLSGNRDDVIIEGGGMAADTSAGIGHGIYILADRITIADITIRDTRHHGIFVNPGSDNNLFHNIRIIDTGEQLFKASGDSSMSPKNDSIIQCSRFEYTTTLDDADDGYYTNGIDLLNSHRWIIRDNRFVNIRHHSGITNRLAGPAILVWRGSSDTLVERNSFMNCDFGISFGNAGGTGIQHSGGIIRNNMIRGYMYSDFGIGIIKSTNARVVNNTIYSPGSWAWSIETRYSESTGVVNMNNLTDEPIFHDRDGASASLSSNITNAVSSFFIDETFGDFSLVSGSIPAVNSGEETSYRTDDITCYQISDGMPDAGAWEYQN